MWLDAGRLYVVGDQAVAAIGASDGALVWAAPLPAGASVRTAALAKRYVVVVGAWSSAGDGLGGPERVAVFFLDRAAGRWSGPPAGGGESLGGRVALCNIALKAGIILVRDGAALTGWAMDGPSGERTWPH